MGAGRHRHLRPDRAGLRRTVDAVGWSPCPADAGPELLLLFRLESGRKQVRRPRPDLRHPGHRADRDGHRRAGQLRHRLLPHRSGTALAAWPGRHRHRTAGGHSLDHLRHVGPVRAGAGDDRVRHPVPQRNPGRMADHRPGVPGPAAGHRHAHRRLRAGDHGHPLHLLGDARSVPDRADAPEGIGLRAGFDQVGSELGHRAALHPLGGDRWRVPRLGPRTGRDDGRGLRDRQQRAPVAVAAGTGHHHRRADRQRLRRSH
ncbi:hypothetical protein D3C81_1195160 [compost metagenome]